MKKTLSLILCLTMLLSLMGIASADEKIKLQFMGWEASVYETEANKAAIAAFEADNPEYEVEFITGKYDDHHTRLMTMMAGNAAPDVFYMEPCFSRQFSDQGLLLDITETFKKEFEGIELIDWSYEKMDLEGTGVYYGIDSCIVGNIMFINPALFREAGLEVPSTKTAMTWDEMLDYAQKLTIREGDVVKQYGVYGLEDRNTVWGYWLYNGVTWVNENDEVKISDPVKAAEILNKIKALRTEYGVAPAGTELQNSGMSANQMLQTGKLAMVMAGSYSMQELSKMGFEYIAVKPPVFDHDHPVGIVNSSYNCAVWSGSKYPEAAVKLASYLTREDTQLIFVRDGLWMSNRAYLYEPENFDKWMTDAHPEGFEDLVPIFQNGTFVPTYRLLNANLIDDIFTEEFENFFYNDQSAEDTIMIIEQRCAAL